MIFRVALLVAALVSVVPLTAEAQKAGKTYRIDYLGSTPPRMQTPDLQRMGDNFLDELRTDGYVEGQNLVFDRRYHKAGSTGFPLSPRSSFGSIPISSRSLATRQSKPSRKLRRPSLSS